MKRHLTAALVIATLVSIPALAGPPVRTVALTNSAAPGASPGTIFAAFSGLALNNNGKTLFATTLSGGGTSPANDKSYWVEESGGLALMIREGSPAPGTEAGVTFGDIFISSGWSDSGESVLWAQLNGSSNPFASGGHYSYSSGALSLLALPGMQAPGTGAGVTFGNMLLDRVPAISDNGTIVIEAMLQGPGVNVANGRAVWTQSSGPLTLAFRSGTQAPGFAAGVTINGPQGLSNVPVINDLGEFAFQGTLAGPGIAPSTGSTIWSTGGGSLHMVARSGSQAPGAPAGVNFTGFFPYPSVLLNNSGETAFHGFTSDGEGIWSERGGLHAVARTGDSAPALPGDTFEAFAFPILNDAGRVAFRSTLASGAQGIWSEGTGSLLHVASFGDQAPGAPAGVTFAAFDLSGTINNRGQLAFFANVNGPGGPGDGIWVHDVDGVLRAIVRSGDTIEVAAGDVRTVSGVGGYSFNDLGQLAFQALFSNGTQGVFVTDVVAIPEPAAWALALVAFGAVRCRRGW